MLDYKLSLLYYGAVAEIGSSLVGLWVGAYMDRHAERQSNKAQSR